MSTLLCARYRLESHSLAPRALCRDDMRILCLGLAVLFGGVTSLPAHYHSCTFNFTGGPRLPFPFCNASLDVRPLCIPQMRGSAPGDATVAPIGRFPRARPALPHDLRRKERRPRCVQSGGRASRSSEHDRRGVHAWGQQRLRQEVKREHRLPDDIPIGRGPRCFVRSAAVARNWAHDRHRSAWAEQPGAHAQRLSYAFLCPLPALCAGFRRQRERRSGNPAQRPIRALFPRSEHRTSPGHTAIAIASRSARRQPDYQSKHPFGRSLVLQRRTTYCNFARNAA